jgi:PTH1 family peptidyl-tRNA hydrolase
MKLIVGLGNPGAEYERTRHNIGWWIADAFAKKFRIEISRHEKNALTGEGRVKLLTNAYLESTDDLMIVYDEVDLRLGKLRIRPNGSSGTHNGMRSVVASLASERFARLRFGVRGPDYEQASRLRDYVLDEFTAEELPVVEATVVRAVDALFLFARGDLKRAMNEFNRDPVPKCDQ